MHINIVFGMSLLNQGPGHARPQVSCLNSAAGCKLGAECWLQAWSGVGSFQPGEAISVMLSWLPQLVPAMPSLRANAYRYDTTALQVGYTHLLA